jgi:hypothetical protein
VSTARGGKSRLVREFTGLLSAIGLALAPKCPMCVAAYVAAATGMSLSFTTASMVRWMFLAACGIALAVVAVSVIPRRRAGHGGRE